MTIIIKTNYQAKHVCFSTFVIIMNQTTLLNSRIQFIVPNIFIIQSSPRPGYNL